jgi:hypothetical protein
MKKLFLKSLLYIFLIVIALELCVRMLHLYTEVPTRYIDDIGVEKSIPNETGFAVTGNRRQNYSEYKINKSGFNSFREFKPTKQKIEIAIIGDSFIEGMHQNYYNSIGKKLEEKLKNVEVYEYGYAGYDLSNQLYLINKYTENFKLINYIIIYLKFENDLTNGSYTPNNERIALLSSPLFKIRDQFKLLSYASMIGAVDPIKHLAIDIINRTKAQPKKSEQEEANKDSIYLENFKKLVATYGFDKKKVSFLLNSKTTSPLFLEYCNSNDYQIIDFADAFENSNKPPTLIYDMHWNNHGRELIALEISNYLKTKLNL